MKFTNISAIDFVHSVSEQKLGGPRLCRDWRRDTR